MASGNNPRHIHAKWAGPNTPFVKISKDAGLDEQRVYLSKKEILALAEELNRFIDFYKEDFSESRIDIEDEPWYPCEDIKI